MENEFKVKNVEGQKLHVAMASFSDYDFFEERVIGVFDSYQKAENGISEYVYAVRNLPPNPLTESEKDNLHTLPMSRRNIYDRWSFLKNLSNTFDTTYIKEVNLNTTENYE